MLQPDLQHAAIRNGGKPHACNENVHTVVSDVTGSVVCVSLVRRPHWTGTPCKLCARA